MSELSTKTGSKSQPKLWNEVNAQDLIGIQGVCLDIDDTLSTAGKLTSDAYAALWTLKNAGFFVVPITGRPAGWCDHFARFWPVDAVVGENGAFTFFMEKGVRRRINTPAGSDDLLLKKKLQDLGEKVRARFPKARWASDQSYREYDLAIDICEDVDPWTHEEVNYLLELCKNEGAHAKLSSIHVNVWFGDYDKRKGFEHWLGQGAPGCLKNLPKDQWIYIGDSPNDEPMFGAFRYSVGVANLKKYLDQIQSPPTWLTDSESGKGFAEMAQKLVQSRKI